MADEQGALSEDAHNRILREEILTDPNFTAAASRDRPKLIVLGGQPGAGKGRLVDRALAEMDSNAVTVDPDKLRDRHRLIDQFQSNSPYEWSSPTQKDAGAWADELRAASLAKKRT